MAGGRSHKTAVFITISFRFILCVLCQKENIVTYFLTCLFFCSHQESDYTCIEKLEVVSPPSVLHASPFTKWIHLEGRPRLYTVYRCKWGYVPAGKNKNLYCQQRQWVGPRPKCVRSGNPSICNSSLSQYITFA